MFLIRVCNKIRLVSREKINHIFGKCRRKKLYRDDFTIISNNCWAGHVYRYFNKEYLSPTIGLYFFQDDYIEFCKNLKKYIDAELSFISFEDSKYYNILKNKSYRCPIGKLLDVEIVFLHYKSEDEAYQKWTRRCKRINWENMFIKDSQQNLCSQQNIMEFEELPYDNKFIFVTSDYKTKSQVLFDDGFLMKDNIDDDTLNFRKYIDLIKLLNRQDGYKLRQRKTKKRLKRI